MRKLIENLTPKTEMGQKWSTIAFVGAILVITAFGFIADSHGDAINNANLLLSNR